MIKCVRIENYKALRNVALDLTPVHALIGPNDSGKTSLLEAVAALCRTTDHPVGEAFLGTWEGTSLVWNHTDARVSLSARVADAEGEFDYSLSVGFAATGRVAIVERETFDSIDMSGRGADASRVFIAATNPISLPHEVRQQAERVRAALSGVHLYRWNPTFLALPVAPDSKRRFRMESNGFGLALCLDDILGFDRDRFIALEKRYKAVFPQVRSIKLMAEPAFRAPADDATQVPQLNRAEGKGIYFELEDGGRLVAAPQVCDGMLLVLAYLTVLYLPQPPRVVLVEEPENGIHPKRLQDVLGILRDLVGEQSHSQVLLTTHSPYALDLFKPEEVTLCQKASDGSISVRRLSESQAVREQLDVFTLGEIWTAEGDEGLNRQAAGMTDALR
jgi:predicted ATPase